MALQDDRIATKPSRVVRRTSSRLMPSMPNMYRAPMEWIQGTSIP